MFDFAKLIRPIDLETFERNYWEKRPLIISRDQKDYYGALLSLEDVDEILSESSLNSPMTRVVRDGEIVPQRKLTGRGLYGHIGSLERLYAELGSGATVVLQSVHERWKPLRDLCQSLAGQFSAAFHANVYLTPPHSRGLKSHFDTHDVFVLQTFGSKKWRLFESPTPLPLPSQAYRDNSGDRKESFQEFELRAGQLIYIPRGWKHDASTGNSMSLHITVGVYPVLWTTVLLQAIESIFERDVRFRRSLPIGFAANGYDRTSVISELEGLIDALRDGMESSFMIESAAEGASLGRQPSLDGHLLDLAAVPYISQRTRFRRRPGVPWRLSLSDGGIRLTFHGKGIDLPAHIEPELRFIIESEEFSPDSLPGDLDDEGRLVLARRLVEEGFLEIRDRNLPSD